MLDEEGEGNPHVMAKLDIGNRLFFCKKHVKKLLGIVVVGSVCDEELLPGAISSATVERDNVTRYWCVTHKKCTPTKRKYGSRNRGKGEAEVRRDTGMVRHITKS